MKEILKLIMSMVFSKKYSQIYSIIDKYEYVSFDIFDTLVKRNVKNHTDIFDIIEKRYNGELKDFRIKRLQAENTARKKSKYEEITLKEIYDELDYDKDVKNKLLNLEIETEKQFCTSNRRMHEIYEYCLKRNKKIYITTDMYLPKKVIEEILEKNKYKDYTKLYLSSEYRLTKHSGKLFEKILEEQNIKSRNIIHIGDNIKSDYFNPRKLNIKSILVKKYIKNNSFQTKKNKTLEYNIMSSFINNNINDKADNYTKFGYEIFGPILYSFTNFIHKKIVEDKIDGIYFLARDAKIIMKAYEELFYENVPIYYINISRKSAILANLENLKDFDDLFNRAKPLLLKLSTIEDMLKVFMLKNINYQYKDRKIKELNTKEKEEIYEIIKDQLEKNSIEQNNYLKEYLKQNNFIGNIAIVDVGWSGTIQYYLQKYINEQSTILGYYYGIEPIKINIDQNTEKIKRIGFLYNNVNKEESNWEYQSIIGLSRNIFESMFLSTECSTIGYKKDGNFIKPIFDEKDNSQQNEILINKILIVFKKCFFRIILEFIF